MIHSTPPPTKEPSITRSLESATQQASVSVICKGMMYLISHRWCYSLNSLDRILVPGQTLSYLTLQIDGATCKMYVNDALMTKTASDRAQSSFKLLLRILIHKSILLQPVMKDSTINQSASFKKLMYSVMGDSDF